MIEGFMNLKSRPHEHRRRLFDQHHKNYASFVAVYFKCSTERKTALHDAKLKDGIFGKVLTAI